MTKTELIQRLASKNLTPLTVVANILSDLETELASELRAEGKVTLRNICTLQIKDRAARMARNPQTGEPIEVPAKQVVTAKAHGTMKQVV